MKKAIKIIIFILLAGAAGAYYYRYSTRPVQVRAAILVREDLLETFTTQATVIPEVSIILNAGENGFVSGLPFQIGNSVKKGEAVAVLTGEADTELELRISQAAQALAGARQEYNTRYGASGSAKIKYELAQSELEAAKWNYDAAKSLNELAPGTVPQAEIKQLEQIVSAAEQSLQLARLENGPEMRAFYLNQISACERQLATLESIAGAEPVVAPFDAILWELYVEKGQYAMKRQPLAKIYQKGKMLLEATVLTEDALRLSLGEKVRCAVANREAFEATVTYISPVAQRTLSAIGIEENRSRIELDPGALPESVGAGHQLDITFVNVIAPGALTAPISAVIPLPGGGDGVYLVIDSKATLAPVSVGVKSGGKIEITGGLSEGSVLILNPFDENIKEGTVVSYQ